MPFTINKLSVAQKKKTIKNHTQTHRLHAINLLLTAEYFNYFNTYM